MIMFTVSPPPLRGTPGRACATPGLFVWNEARGGRRGGTTLFPASPPDILLSPFRRSREAPAPGRRNAPTSRGRRRGGGGGAPGGGGGGGGGRGRGGGAEAGRGVGGWAAAGAGGEPINCALAS